MPESTSVPRGSLAGWLGVFLLTIPAVSLGSSGSGPGPRIHHAELDRLWQVDCAISAATPELVHAFAGSHPRPVAHSANSALYELARRR